MASTNSKSGGSGAPARRARDVICWPRVFEATLIVLVLLMIATGRALGARYDADPAAAFDSVVRFVREVPYGWWIHATHDAATSFLMAGFFLYVLFALWREPIGLRARAAWSLASIAFAACVVAAVTGAVLRFSQVDYWTAILVADIAETAWLKAPTDWIDHALDLGFSQIDFALEPYLNLHVLAASALLTILLLRLALLVFLAQDPPNSLAADGAAICAMLGALALLVLVAPTAFLSGGDAAAARPSTAPATIDVAWYLAPFFGMLKSVPDRDFGALSVALVFPALILAPWLGFGSAAPGSTVSWARGVCFWVFVGATVALGVIGASVGAPVDWGAEWAAPALAIYVFAYLLGIRPALSVIAATSRRSRAADAVGGPA